MRIPITLLGVLLAGVFATPASAQYRKWDFGAGFGILGTSNRDFGGSEVAGRNTDPGVTWNIEAGRYLTTHLKADAGLMQTNARSYYDATNVSPGPTFVYSSLIAHPTSVSGALTYQFFENVFAHPFVSAGIRLTSIDEERQTFSYGPSYATNTTTVTTRRYAEARPFVAAGYKSYFNERAYMKSELLFALDRKGVSHGTLRIGFGIDF